VNSVSLNALAMGENIPVTFYANATDD